MRIVKEGKLPPPPKLAIYVGKCYNCECIVEANEDEVDIDDIGDEPDGTFGNVKCPTKGCTNSIPVLKKGATLFR